MGSKRILVFSAAQMITQPCLSATAASAESSEIQTVTCVPDYETIFPNPERGFCQYVDIIDPKIFPAEDDPYFFYRPYLPEGAAEVSTSRILHSYIRLDYYGDTPQLPRELLDDLAKGLAEVRREGMKIVLLYTYSMTMDWPRDIPIDIIMSHIKQINKVITANADVVLAIEAGFFGPSGEWHANVCTSWFDRNGEDNPAVKDARAALVKGILETTTEHIKVGWYNTKLPASGNDPAETTYQRLLRKMGYRLRLVSASFRKSADPGDTFDFSAVIDNDGYAGPINPRPVYLVFDNGTTRHNVRLNGVEVRSWLGGEDHSGPYDIEAKDIKVPADLPAGNYTLALWLPDSFESLQSRPEYSIRLANKYMWDAQKGYNKMGVVTIGSTEAGMSGWAKNGVESAVNFGVATPELCNNYKSATTRAEFCRAVVNLLEQYYNMPVAGIIHKRDLLLLEQPFGYWIGDTAKNSDDPNERIEGLRSMVGRGGGSSDWNPIIFTNPEQLPLKAGKTYEVRFRYKIIEAPDKGFTVCFNSEKGNAAKVWIPMAEILGKAGDTDEVVMTRTLGPYDDYIVYWNIPGNGVVAIDSIIITEKGAKTPAASFDFEIPPLKPEPSTGTYLLSTDEMQDIHTDLGLQNIYRDFLEKRRAMLTVMPSFTDTSDPAIRAAAALGITSGTGNGTFSPDAPLTREQAATMLTNVMKIIGENTSSAPTVKWKDDKDISSWVQTTADVMYSYKIMSGTSAADLVFSPKSPYTHEQSLMTLNNLWKYMESK